MSHTPYERVKLARSNKRPTGLDYIKNIFSDFTELHGDRRYGDDKAVVGGIACLDDSPVTVVAIEKGHTAKERSYRNFGAPNPEGYRKALRLMKQAEKLAALSYALSIHPAPTAVSAQRSGDRGRRSPKI